MEYKDKNISSENLTVKDKEKEVSYMEYKDKEFSRDTETVEGKYKKSQIV